MITRFVSLVCPRPGRALLVLMAAAILSTGCASIAPHERLGTPASEKTAAAQAPPQVCQVELRPKSGKPQIKRVELTGEQHVGDVLAQTGALRRFGSCEIAVVRPQPDGNMAK